MNNQSGKRGIARQKSDTLKNRMKLWVSNNAGLAQMAELSIGHTFLLKHFHQSCNTSNAQQ